MNKIVKISVTILFLITAFAAVWMIPPERFARVGGSLIISGPASFLNEPQQAPEGDKVVLGGSYILEEGQTLKGNLMVFGGTAQLAKGSLVTGDVAVMGGTLTIHGEVEGEVIAIGGLVVLGPTAQIHGEINTVSAKLDRAEGAVVDGAVNNFNAGPISLVVPKNLQLPDLDNPSVSVPRDITFNPAWSALMVLIRSFIWATLAVLVALFLPKSLERVAGAAVGSTFASGGLGCLTILIVPLLLVLIAITICGIPISLIGFLLLIIAWAYGVIALGAETGKRLASLLKSDWALPVSAAVGVFILTLVAGGIGSLIPCVGWIVPALIGAVGLGAALLTRFGTKPYGVEQSSADFDSEFLPPPSSATMINEESQKAESDEAKS